MNPHDDTPDDIKDEEQIAAALAAAQIDAAPPDAEALARIRAQSTEAFTAAPLQRAPTATKRPAPFARARWLGAAAAVILIGFGLYSWLAPGLSGATLGQVLENLEKADTLHVRLTRGDQKLEFWHTSKPNRSRWDDLDGNYRIADSATLWIINEKANEARRENPPPKKRRAVDQLLDLLWFEDAEDLAKVFAAVPVKRSREGDVDVFVYRVEVFLRKMEKVQLEARVIAKSQRLQSIRTWPEKGGHEDLFTDLAILAYDEPIAAKKFAIADTLTEDGRIGKVTDVQGIVSIKPVLHERWTPVREHLVLKPGDWVRTDARGANATALRLVKNTGVILGPKTLVELIGPKQIRLIEGRVEISPSAGASIELLGPAQQKLTVKSKQSYRIEKQQLAQVAKDPPWLLGFKGAAANESLGSLVALVDGRNVPLTVGYHKVSVDIRDQIARTVIEESFVNHTNAELEGVFSFPLPADASISGFGMWIGDNLVEADVVEKQRAREIYETIKRERRDPGLLEWSGGNLFKARVFPIAANSEKRVRITYTQVLPLKGSRYRYSYALRSEMLQQHPLRDLSIDVKVNSVIPLKSVTSPTHPTRDALTPHSAHIEFTAQEYTPTRDFEVVVEVEGGQADVVMIPHRRGDDGYFMLQLTPPGAAGNWDRPLLPNGEPVRLLILADTSASIDAAQRATQATFIGSLLAALTPKDTFNLATMDVTCDWAFAEALAADAKNVAAARDFLAKRSSLGWTDLNGAFAAALKQWGAKTHVIYVGDSIITTGDADPVALKRRLEKLVSIHTGTFHAVTLGSSYEPAVMKAIASAGGGSMRKITGEQGPAVVARELLGEIAQPALRDIKVEFKGFKVARVYPESLANLPAGSQQILLGRYLPDGKDQAGDVIVTGIQGGKPVRFSTRASFKDAEQGNSFIPRLWARMHLDALLEQGSSDTIKDEIIALSEEFQIITPYTSLLVLETDADRERFKVKRRFQMRDGERFFADGRDNAVFDLAQKQMKKAGAWRTALRRSVLNELARLGREPRLFQPARHREYLYQPRMVFGKELELLEYDLDGPVGGAGRRVENLALDLVPLGESLEVVDELVPEFKLGERQTGDVYGIYKDEADKKEALVAAPLELGEPFGAEPASRGGELYFRGEMAEEAEARELRSEPFGFISGGLLRKGQPYRSRGPRYGQWLNTLFPPLYGAPGKAEEPKSTWPAAARDLAQSLLRSEQLAKMTAGIEIVRQSDSFDVRWGDLTTRSRRLELVSAKSWLTRSASDGGQTLVSWCDAKEIGIFSKAVQLGRVRASTPLDVQPPPLELSDHSLTSLELAFRTYNPTIEPQGKDRTLLVLKHPDSPAYETRVLIDTARHVILSIVNQHKGKTTGATRFDDFVEAAGSWWARKIETTDESGKRSSLVTQTVKTLTLAQVDQQTKTELAGRSEVQFLHLPMPSVASAKRAVAAGKAGFDEQFVLMLHFHRSQQWARVLDHLQQAEKLAASKPGARWLRSALLYDSRRHEELRRRYQQEALRLAKAPSGDAYFQAEYIVGQSANVLQANEMLTLVETLQPVYEQQPRHVNARLAWLRLRVSYLNQAGRTDEALRLQKQLATDFPRDYSAQQQHAQALAGGGDYPAAYAWLTRVLVKESKWLDYEEERLRNTYAELLEQQGRFTDLVAYLAAWVEQNPAGTAAYQQYLSALIKTDQIEKADALALRWLKEAQVPDKLSPPADARLEAAIYLMRGNIYRLYTNHVEERWLSPLAQAALYFARHEAHASSADLILSNDQFARTEEARALRKALAKILLDEAGKLPAEQVLRFVGWVHAEDASPAAWDTITAKLRQRWTNEAKDDAKHVLGQALVRLLSRRDEPTDLLTFLRLQWQKGSATRRAQYAEELFNHLLAQPWSAEFEGEASALLDKLSDADEPGARLVRSVAALHRLTDRVLEGRYAARMKTVEHPEKLTRTELLKKQADFRKLAREGLADRLRKEAAKHPKALGNWLVAESIYLDVPLDRNLKQAAADAWAFLDAAPKKNDADERTMERGLDEALRERYLVTLMNLAARKGAEPALVQRLLKFVDSEISANAEDGRWKLAKYRLLIALDRTKNLEQTLRQWTHADDPDNRWRIALGYLLAEQGRLPEAIGQVEAVESDDELSPGAYRALADWYLAQNQRDKHERAAAAVYRTMSEYHLSRLIAAKLQPWQRGDGRLPTELDREVLRVFAVLFEKSARPESYLPAIQQFYQASHDFRLLAGLPDAVLGHTAERVYPFVQGMDSVLGEVRDEATADEIVKRIGEVRPRAKTVVDQRSLDLLEAMVERRAAEVVNQPGPHREKALAALQRAFKREWGPGEPRLMADFLAGLGKITQPALADEQLRQLKALHSEAKASSPDRLHVADRYAAALHDYQRGADAIDVLQAALDEFQIANDGVLPVAAHGPLTSFISFLGDAGHFARGEKILLAQLAHPVHAEQRRWLINRLDELYLHALQKDGDVSLGKGLALYRALNSKIQRDVADAEPLQRYQLIEVLCNVYRTAHEKKLPGAGSDLKAFAFEIAPPLVKGLTNYQPSIVGILAQTVHDLIGPRDGIAFLLNEIEREPRWLRYASQDGWSRHGATLAEWRMEAKDLGDVEGRLLKRVLAELRRDLVTRENRNRAIYQMHTKHFWTEKAADFATTAEDVLAERSKFGASVQYIANYFYHGLDRHKRAIEILFVAYRQKLLDETGQAKLVEFLQEQDRHGESIAILQPLIERRPANLNYRVLLMHAYFKTARQAELLALLQETDAFFHKKDRWNEHPLSGLAFSTLQNELFEQSVAYFKELIPLHERTQPGRGIGDGTLSTYYTGLANAYVGLKKTPEAVEAASAAIVAWGGQRDQRARALEALTRVLVRSPDLDGFVMHWDKQSQDSAIVRKALGQAYQEKQEHAKAIKQFEAAAALQPSDAQIDQLLIASLDETGDKEGAIRQLLKAAQFARRDLKLYQQLAERYAAAGQAAQAERAYTSIIEMQPNEAESHAVLAEIREKQNRWPDAMHHWERVAQLRALEPTGLLKLAAAQIHERQWDKARETLRRLDRRTWPARFGNVQREVRTLEERMATQRKK